MTIALVERENPRPRGRLLAHHAADLKRSGLSDETIQSSGIYSADAEETRRLLGFDVGAGMVIPYPGEWLRDDLPYCQVKPDTPPILDGKPAKYVTPKGAGNRIYVPPILHPPKLTDPRVPLYITEGAKKALKACQEGLCCVALSGVSSWKDRRAGKSQVIPELERIPLKGRTVSIVYDSDIRAKVPVQYAEFNLARELRARGADVFAIPLPPGPAGEKVGLDDYLCTHSLETFCGIEPVPIQHPARQPRLAPVSLGAFMQNPPPSRADLIAGGLLVPKGITIIGGAPKTGKTLLTIHLALCLTSGQDFLGFPVRRCKVLLTQQEISAQAMYQRLSKMWPEARQWSGDPTRDLALLNETGIILNHPPDLASLTEAIREHEAQAVILDPLARFHTVNENDASDIGPLIQKLRKICYELGCSFVLVHHFRKPVEGRDEGPGSLRGSSVLHAEADALLTLDRKDLQARSPEYVRLGFDLRHEEAPPPMVLYRDPETLLFDVVKTEEPPDIKNLLQVLAAFPGPALQPDLIAAVQARTGRSERPIREDLYAARNQGLLERDWKPGRGSKATWALTPAGQAIVTASAANVRPP